MDEIQEEKKCEVCVAGTDKCESCEKCKACCAGMCAKKCEACGPEACACPKE